MVLEEIKEKASTGKKDKSMTIDEFVTEMIISGGMTEFTAKKWIKISDKLGYIKINKKTNEVTITDKIKVKEPDEVVENFNDGIVATIKKTKQ
jgi:hypothetical protein